MYENIIQEILVSEEEIQKRVKKLGLIENKMPCQGYMI